MYFVSQVNDEFVENGRIEMLAHLNKKEKVSIGTVANNRCNVRVLVAFGTLFQKMNSEKKWLNISSIMRKYISSQGLIAILFSAHKAKI